VIGVCLLPWHLRKEVKLGFRLLFLKEKNRFPETLKASMSVLRTRKLPEEFRHRSELSFQVLRDGLELIELGIERGQLEKILRDRVLQQQRRLKKVANAMRALAKYPPALGLTGTVFGLVNIMKGLANNAGAGALGVEMSIALVATMYGLLVANFLVNPIGEMMLKKIEEENDYTQVAFEAIFLIMDETSYLESVEILNSLVPDQDREKFRFEEAS
jgi:flagellar motor component MotA